jgi:hypothetical protein
MDLAEMAIKNTLLEYSEWLDSQGLLVGDGVHWTSVPRKKPGEDERTHTELVEDFLRE